MVIVHEFKQCDLGGGTLIVSIPHIGIGNVLLTDFLLEQQHMDQVAAFDAEQFPPVAMLHEGKARFPVRIHADTDNRIAVLRSEFPMHTQLMRPLAHAILDWSKAHNVGRIVTLDSLWLSGHEPEANGAADERPLLYSSLQESIRNEARDHGMKPFREGALAGVPAMLVLNSRLREMPVLAMLATIATPEEDLDSATRFAEGLKQVVNGLEFDRQALRKELRNIHQAVETVQAQARAMVRELQKRDGSADEGIETPAMYM